MPTWPSSLRIVAHRLPIAAHRLAQIVLLVTIFSALISAPSMALELDPELSNELAKSADGRLELMIVLEAELDYEQLEATVAGRSFEYRRDRMMETLQEHARESQAGLLADLQLFAAKDNAEAPRSSWLANAIFMEGGEELLSTLAKHPAQGLVSLNPIHSVVEVAERPSGPTKPSIFDELDEVGPQKAITNVWSVEWINVPQVWAQGYDGTGVLIGHIDSGAWLEHPDLVNRLWINEGEIPDNLIDDDGNGYVDDVHGWDFGDRDSDPTDDGFTHVGGGHGTHTAGTVVGDGSGGINTGVAPGAKIIVAKPTWSELGTASGEAIYEAQEYCIAMGARLMTMSLGAVGVPPVSMMQTERRVGNNLRLLGVPLITSSGNAHGQAPPIFETTTVSRVPSPWNEDPTVPYSSRSGVISVGATAYQSDTIWEFSSQGPVDWGVVPPWNDWDHFGEDNGLIKPDVSAPGNGISSLIRPSGYSQTNWSGTSMACPHVSGVAALLLQKNPSLMPEDIDRILQLTAVDLGDPGKDNLFGSGRVDALAAINAVPATVHPSLVISGHEFLDDNGNGSIDPGEDFALNLAVFNNSFTVDAQQVSAFIAVVNDPLVQVVDSTVQIPDIPFGATTETGQGLVLHADASAPQGYEFVVTVGFVAQEGYWTSIDLTLEVGFPELRTHNPQGLRLTVTDRGTLGWWDMDQVQGDGAGPQGGANFLWAGGFWGGNGRQYLCNRDYVPTDPTEWELVTEPNGRLAPTQPQLADEHYTGIFEDSGHPQPKGVRVTQQSMSWMDDDAADFVILSYQVENRGTETIVGYRAGVFMDWDMLYPFYTRAATDDSRDLVYINDFYITGEHAGVRVLTPMGDATTAVIHNPTFVHPNLQILDEDKWRIMNGSLDGVVGDTDDDWSNLAATGAFDLEPGQTVLVAFAVVYGESLEDLQSNADLAMQRYTSTPTATDDLPSRGHFALGQNIPNPFNPTTTIQFQMDRSGPVRLSVLDVKGRVVRVLSEGVLDEGSHVVSWNGVDQDGRRVSSGVYFYRLETADRTATRKMVMVK